jgi:hypothetical protein
MNGAIPSINYIFTWNNRGNSIFTLTIWQRYADPKCMQTPNVRRPQMYADPTPKISFKMFHDYSCRGISLLMTTMSTFSTYCVVHLRTIGLIFPRTTCLPTCLPTYTRTYLPSYLSNPLYNLVDRYAWRVHARIHTLHGVKCSWVKCNEVKFLVTGCLPLLEDT